MKRYDLFRGMFGRAALAAFTLCVSHSAICSAQTGANQQLARYVGPESKPDIVGGYRSDHVLVRVQPNVLALDGALHPWTIELRHDRISATTFSNPSTLPADHPDDRAGPQPRDGSDTPLLTLVPALAYPPSDLALAHSLGLDRCMTVAVPAGMDVLAFRSMLASFNNLFEVVELETIGGLLDVPNDPMFNQQTGLRNLAHPGADVHAVDAWSQVTSTNRVTLAVVDTGVSMSHPDLAGNLLAGRNFADGVIDNTDDSTIVSHGTCVAGIAAARGNNGLGITGLSWGAPILPVRVANRFGSSSETQCGNGIMWAVDNGARVINVSMGFSGGSAFFASAAQYAHDRGAFLCASAGNTPGIPIPFPARFPSVCAVGASDSLDHPADFNTTGPEMVVVAPGVDILCTNDTATNQNGYAYETGTSMACPFVAALACLLWSVDPMLSNDQVRFAIIATAHDIGEPGWDPQSGWGRIDAGSAVWLVSTTPIFTCAADWNHDGHVTSQDLFDFVGDYLRFNADSNGDGHTDSDDFFLFLTQYFNGC